MTLVEFLTARLDEDEHRAPKVQRGRPGALYIEPDPHSRTVREVEAKRAIVKVMSEADAKCPEDDWPDDGDMAWAPLSDQARWTLRHLAAVYVDHPDYREAWKP